MSIQAWVIKKFIAPQFSGWMEDSVEERRALQEKMGDYNKLPVDVRCQPVHAGGAPAEWIETPGAGSEVILYLHGGGYVLGSIHSHRELIARLARAANSRALALEYRLAPEYPFPAAVEDSHAAYTWLLDQGVAPNQIILAGDSAGGGLALATLVAARGAGQPLPAGVACFSPWVDLTGSGASIERNARVDPILEPAAVIHYAGLYAGEHDLRAPLISPLFADLQGFPPMLIQVGTDEILLDDAARLAERARAAGVTVTLETYRGLFHVFQMIPQLPETKKAVRMFAAFAANCLQAAV